MAIDLCNFFDRVVVINLLRRPDRLESFFERLEKSGWPFKWPEVIDAVDGNKVPCPSDFTEGGGAFGCRQSHVSILENCLMRDIDSVLVLEDDANPLPGFIENVTAFLEALPPDWEGVMLGGQHHAEPELMHPGVVKVRYAQRTHAYACRGRYMRSLYKLWCNAKVHIDWLMKDWQHQYNIYAPERFLIGQARSQSDINGRLNSAKSWNPQNGSEPVVILCCPRNIAAEARKWGFHSGYDIDARTGIDVGLMGAFQNYSIKPNLLKEWIDRSQRQVSAMDQSVCTIWHPDATLEMVQQATAGMVYKIDGDTIEEILDSAPEEVLVRRKLERCDKYVVLLRSSVHVMERLRKHGFHSGYARDKNSRIDLGLKDVYASGECNYEKMRKWVELLRSETYAMNNAVVTAWHPLVTKTHLERSCPMNVIEIESDNVEEAIKVLENA